MELEEGALVWDRCGLGAELEGVMQTQNMRGLGKRGRFSGFEHGARRTRGESLMDQRNLSAVEAFWGIQERMVALWALSGEFAEGGPEGTRTCEGVSGEWGWGGSAE